MSHAPSELASELFEEHLRRRNAGEPHDFDELCAKHPELREQLQLLREADALLAEFLPGELAPPPSDAAAQASAEALLRRLREADVRHQRYQVLDEVGRGGMGVVLRVRDSVLRRELALKLARGGSARAPQSRADVRSLARFLDEAQITGQLDHPGVVPVHELGLDADGRAYFTMRLVRGEELGAIFARVRERRAGWTQERAVTVLLRVCEAMSYAHHKRVVHRDLKPSNVMVGEFGEVYVMDWGLARTLDAAADGVASEAPRTERAESGEASSALGTLAGDVLGTPHYMAPEQARGERERIGPSADIYAIGAMLHELLAGAPPYAEHLSSAAVISAAKAGPPRSISELARRAHPELIAIASKAMAREIDERYATMRQLADDLRAYSEGRVVLAFETGAWAETKKWVSRNRALAAALVALIAALSIGVLVSQFYARRAQRSADLFAASARLDDLLRATADLGGVAELAAGTSERWMRRAKALITGQSDEQDRAGAALPGLQEWQQELDTFVAEHLGAQDQAPLDIEPTFPRAGELEALRAECLWRTRMLEGGWPSEQAELEALTDAERGAACLVLNKQAFDEIRPDDSPRYGGEVRAVVLARLALKAAGSALEQARCSDTLAFALARFERFEEALSSIDRACASAELAIFEALRRGEPRRTIDLCSSAVFARDLRSNRELIRAAVEQWTEGLQAELTERRREELAALERDSAWFARRLRLPTERRSEFDQLVALVGGLYELAQRVDSARRSIDTPDARARWRVVAEWTARDPRFGAHPISPQIDLLPIGLDPHSSLWEFAHLPSGLEPRRGDDGRLRLNDDSCVVFVLLPAAEPGVGAEASATDRDRAPYFIAKHELSCDQWTRISGEWPPRATPNHKRRPLTDISWAECMRVLARAGSWLGLPSAVQWRRAAMCGATTRYWCGDDPGPLRQAENLDWPSDPREAPPLRRPRRSFKWTPPDRSGLQVHSLAPNPWGLHHVLGNVRELSSELRADDDSYVGANVRVDQDSPELRLALGGWYGAKPEDAVGAGTSFGVNTAQTNVGIRLARPLLP